MKVLVVGNGGREHVMAWKLAKSTMVERVFVAPGNAGTAQETKVQNVPFSSSDIDGLLEFAKREQIDLTIPGSEVPLELGIVDHFEKADLAIFGPCRIAAQLETSKHFAKQFMNRYQIPTANYEVFTDYQTAKQWIEQQEDRCMVIKLDGLAAGKGVVIAPNKALALEVVQKTLLFDAHKGRKIIIEDYVAGTEVSFIVMIDGERIIPLATSQDHKAIFDGGRGANTGGMGAYSPSATLNEHQCQHVIDTIIKPTLAGLKKENITYKGFLYAGLMVSLDGSINVLEYNCRFGDPEAQPVLYRLKDDFAQLCYQGAQGQFDDQVILSWDDQVAIGVVLASKNYPTSCQKNVVINGPAFLETNNVKVFHSGTRYDKQNGTLLTDGGRVMCVTALGRNMDEARELAYQTVDKLRFSGCQYRSDIGCPVKENI